MYTNRHLLNKHIEPLSLSSRHENGGPLAIDSPASSSVLSSVVSHPISMKPLDSMRAK